MISQHISPDAHRLTMREMCDAGLPQGSVLHTFSLLATGSHDRVAPSLHEATVSKLPAPRSKKSFSDLSAAPAMLQPGAPHASAVQTYLPGGHHAMPGHPVHNNIQGHAFSNSSTPAPTAFCPAAENWPRTLLMLASNRTHGDSLALAGLGDHLWTLNKPLTRVYAHVCYMLAGRPLDPFASSDSRFAAPGVDHTLCVGGCGAADALQRIELLAWCMSQSQSLPMYWLAPHYLQVRFLHVSVASCPLPCVLVVK
jgi:hypothetical protein